MRVRMPIRRAVLKREFFITLLDHYRAEKTPI